MRDFPALDGQFIQIILKGLINGVTVTYFGQLTGLALLADKYIDQTRSVLQLPILNCNAPKIANARAA